MIPGGKTRPYAVLGHPVEHTLSPAMHNAAFATLGRDAVYLAFDVLPEHLLNVLGAMGSMGFAGVNLTVPLKEVAYRGLTDLDESARQAGAVNTIRFTEGGMCGHNTDGYGLLRALEEAFGTKINGEHLVMLGSGGAARAAALTCAREGAASVTVVARNRERAETLKEELQRVAPTMPAAAVCEPADQPATIRQGTLVIQGTPVGMHAEDPPLFAADAFTENQQVYDLIYTFPLTATLKAAQEAGAQVANGLGMLLHQGIRAFEIWTGEAPPIEVMRKALEKAAP